MRKRLLGPEYDERCDFCDDDGNILPGMAPCIFCCHDEDLQELFPWQQRIVEHVLDGGELALPIGRKREGPLPDTDWEHLEDIDRRGWGTTQSRPKRPENDLP